ncbi:MAG: hypothetical protein R8P61_28295 [Bacteroidia bacterium]|nr:hypothetical protein [Bacteroidia bacterium]
MLLSYLMIEGSLQNGDIEFKALNNSYELLEGHTFPEVDPGIRSEQRDLRDEGIRSNLKNQRIDEQMKAYIDAGIATEVDFLERDSNDVHSSKIGDKIFSLKMKYREQGLDFQTASVWNETGDVTGYRCFTINRELSQEQIERQEEIEFIAEKRYQRGWQYEIEERERGYQGEVEAGNMVYLGQLSDAEYFSIRRELAIPFGDIETLPTFDELGNPESDQQKVFVYVNPQN